MSELAAERMRELAESALAAGSPLSWYDVLYTSAEAGTAAVPWDHGEPMPVLVGWLGERYWLQGFDLVVESTTLQCLPPELHEQASAAVAALCAPGGTVLVIARQPSACDPPGPPWLLDEAEVGGVAVNGVELVRLDT